MDHCNARGRGNISFPIPVTFYVVPSSSWLSESSATSRSPCYCTLSRYHPCLDPKRLLTTTRLGAAVLAVIGASYRAFTNPIKPEHPSFHAVHEVPATSPQLQQICIAHGLLVGLWDHPFQPLTVFDYLGLDPAGPPFYSGQALEQVDWVTWVEGNVTENMERKTRAIQDQTNLNVEDKLMQISAVESAGAVLLTTKTRVFYFAHVQPLVDFVRSAPPKSCQGHRLLGMNQVLCVNTWPTVGNVALIGESMDKVFGNKRYAHCFTKPQGTRFERFRSRLFFWNG